MSDTASVRVRLAAAVHGGTPGDIEFYRQACAGATSVLELGCGDGRIATTLLGGDRMVVGIDLDAGALAAAAANGVQAVRADMAGFAFAHAFERILVPFSGLYCLLDATRLDACLRCVSAHLAPTGRLVFDAYAADTFHAGSLDGEFDDEDRVAVVEVDGTTWEVLERSRWWRDRQRIDAWYRHVPADGRAMVASVIRQRYLLGYQVPELLARAGLVVHAMHGDFEGSPFEPGCESIVVLAGPA